MDDNARLEKDGRIGRIILNRPDVLNAIDDDVPTLLDEIIHHSPECMNFKVRSQERGWKETVRERDSGTFDWTANHPINPKV